MALRIDWGWVVPKAASHASCWTGAVVATHRSASSRIAARVPGWRRADRCASSVPGG